MIAEEKEEEEKFSTLVNTNTTKGIGYSQLKRDSCNAPATPHGNYVTIPKLMTRWSISFEELGSSVGDLKKAFAALLILIYPCF